MLPEGDQIPGEESAVKLCFTQAIQMNYSNWSDLGFLFCSSLILGFFGSLSLGCHTLAAKVPSKSPAHGLSRCPAGAGPGLERPREVDAERERLGEDRGPAVPGAASREDAGERGSVRGHVTAAIRALRAADARLPPRLLAGRARSPRPASPSHELAAAAAAWRPRLHHDRYAPLAAAAALLPHTRPPPRGELPAGRNRCEVAGWPQPGVPPSCVSRCPAAPGARAAVPDPERSRGPRRAAPGPPPKPSGSASGTSCSFQRNVVTQRSSCGGCVGGSRLRASARSPERGGVAGRRPYSPPAGAFWKGAGRRGGHAGGPGPASAVSPGAGRSLAEPIFRPLARLRRHEPGERPREAGPAWWKGAGPLVAVRPATRRVCPRGPQTVLLSSNSGVSTATELRKDCRSHLSSAISGRV